MNGAGGTRLTTNQHARRLERWEQLELPAFNVMPYVLLVLSTAGAAAIDSGHASKVIIDVTLGLLTAVWMLSMFTLRSGNIKRPRMMAVFFAGLMALMAAQVVSNPVFGFFTWTGYIWTSRVLQENWRFVGIAATAIVTATSQHGGLPTSSAGSWISWLVIVVVNFLIAGTVSWFSWIREGQNALRKQAIADLTEANAKLEASLRENAGLHAQLLAQAREAGVLDERQRMAREIHDTLAQGLVGIITQLEAAAQTPPADHNLRRHHEAAMQLARESLAEARRSVQALRPVPLEQAQLPDALTNTAAQWSKRTGVETRVTTTGHATPMRPELELALLRTAQEALANVAKHAQARKVVLTLSYMDDQVSLDVRDDGVGLPEQPPASPGGGFGLTAMRQRVEGLDGTLEVESEPGAGTTIAASIPTIRIGAVA
jgi:signal transduction histidine kinase